MVQVKLERFEWSPTPVPTKDVVKADKISVAVLPPLWNVSLPIKIQSMVHLVGNVLGADSASAVAKLAAFDVP